MTHVQWPGGVGGYEFHLDACSLAAVAVAIALTLLEDVTNDGMPGFRAQEEINKPRPAISTFCSCPPVAIAATSCSAISRGLRRAGFASSIARLLAKSPCCRSRVRSTMTAGMLSAGRLPSACNVAIASVRICTRCSFK